LTEQGEAPQQAPAEPGSARAHGGRSARLPVSWWERCRMAPNGPVCASRPAPWLS